MFGKAAGKILGGNAGKNPKKMYICSNTSRNFGFLRGKWKVLEEIHMNRRRNSYRVSCKKLSSLIGKKNP